MMFVTRSIQCTQQMEHGEYVGEMAAYAHQRPAHTNAHRRRHMLEQVFAKTCSFGIFTVVSP
jgi:hypothetical protein